MQPQRARLLLLLLSVCTLHNAIGCILPPEGIAPPVSYNFPPEIDLQTLDPFTPVFFQAVDEQAGEDCLFEIQFDVIERNDCFVGYRLVADNNTPGVRVLIQDNDVGLATPMNGQCPPPPHRDTIESLIRTSDFTRPLVNGPPHTISVFIKDTLDDWAVPRDQVGIDANLNAGALI